MCTVHTEVGWVYRFWSKVSKTVDGCWLWTAATRGKTGYGAFKYEGKVIDAHRMSWELAHGPIPEGLFVCHTCDERLCVNPQHLFLGTSQENALDAVNKGRMKPPAYEPHHKRAKGTENSAAILTEEQVVEIRERYKAGGVSSRFLGRVYGVCHTTIQRIVKGRYWAHVPG